MSKESSLKKVLIPGSGPNIIGRSAEFDYAGIMACAALREEGVETVLINSNPATVMTDPQTADRVYLEPLTEETLLQILKKEKPDGILPGFGGQTALDLVLKLAEDGTLEKYGTRILGVGAESIRKARDRESFQTLMQQIEEPTPASIITSSLVECYDFTETEGFPVIIRPAFVSGGTAIGIADNREQLDEYFARGMDISITGKILLERSVAGWKEIVFEGLRDCRDECLIVCCLETLDPVGIHTKDSIAVAPAQTLTEEEYQKLKDAALRIIRGLDIVGGCNVQFALDPSTGQYDVLEVNPGISRSSALAARAAGYPLIGVSARLALGYSLDEISIGGDSFDAAAEPVMDRIAVKFPHWSFEQFRMSSRKLGTRIKATGEVLAVGSTFESALLKAASSKETGGEGLLLPSVAGMGDDDLIRKLYECDDERIYALAEIMRRGLMDDEKLYRITKIDPWFLAKIRGIIDFENRIKGRPLTRGLLREAEAAGLTDSQIMALSGAPRTVLQDIRFYNDIYPGYRKVCSGDPADASSYWYSCCDEAPAAPVSAESDRILVIGPGPIRIGQGGEYECSCVHGTQMIREMGYEPVVINNNPDAVSMAPDAQGRHYMEPLYIDDVMNVIKREQPAGVIVQLGGHAAMDLAEDLCERSVPVLGTSYEDLALAKDRDRLAALLRSMNIAAPERITASDEDQAWEAVQKLGYPLVVRPSHASGGAMQVLYSDIELEKYLRESARDIEEHPLLIDQYIRGKELEADAVCDGENVLIPGIMEHVERAGVHSGDSISIYPAASIPDQVLQMLVSCTEEIARALHVVGFLNIQYAWDGSKLYVIDVNPRASRAIPVLTRVTGIPIAKVATAAMLGRPLTEWEYGTGLYPAGDLCAAKIPVFSGAALTDMDMALGHEMKSTGEVLGLDTDIDRALYKGFLAEGSNIPVRGNIFLTLRTTDQNDYTADILAGYALAGFRIYATDDTIAFVREHNINVQLIDYTTARNWIMYHKPGDPEEISIVISVPEIAGKEESLSFPVRLAAAELKIPAFSCLDTAKAFLQVIRLKQREEELTCRPL